MRLKSQKNIAAKILKISRKKIVFDSNNLSEVKQAITKSDMRNLVKKKIVLSRNVKGSSKGRIRKNKLQRKKGRQKGFGTRKGRKNARMHGKKRKWINTIRIQRKVLKKLRDGEKITKKNYQMLYVKAKGGFFRSKRHLTMYIEESKLLK